MLTLASRSTSASPSAWPLHVVDVAFAVVRYPARFTAWDIRIAEHLARNHEPLSRLAQKFQSLHAVAAVHTDPHRFAHTLYRSFCNRGELMLTTRWQHAKFSTNAEQCATRRCWRRGKSGNVTRAAASTSASAAASSTSAFPYSRCSERRKGASKGAAPAGRRRVIEQQRGSLAGKLRVHGMTRGRRGWVVRDSEASCGSR